MVRFIQGYFFQRRQVLDLARGEERAKGHEVIVVDGTFNYMFAGVIYTDESGALCGYMRDAAGTSILYNIAVTKDQIRFTKRYNDRPDEILYTFWLADQFWTGKFAGSEVGEGRATCIITEPPEALFELPQ